MSQQELLFALDKNVPVIDIRPPVEYKAGHIAKYEPVSQYLYTIFRCLHSA